MQDKTYEMMTESKVYSLTALFCDIGKNTQLLTIILLYIVDLTRADLYNFYLNLLVTVNYI